MNKNISITSAYWEKDLSNEKKVAAQNCTVYSRLKEPRRILGFKILESDKANKLSPKHIELFFSNNENDDWTLLYSNCALKKEVDIEVLFPEPVSAKYLKAVLKRHHGNRNIHNELTPSERNVPFNSLENFYWITEEDAPINLYTYDEEVFQKAKTPIIMDLKKDIDKDVTCELKSNEIIYTNRFISLSFSLSRPITRLFKLIKGSDDYTSRNLVYSDALLNFGMFSGLKISAMNSEILANMISADITVMNNKIFYNNVSPVIGLKWDYCFEIEPDHILITIDQAVEKELRFIECEAWRWCWNLKESIAANLGMPVQVGKNGRCEFPVAVHYPKYGTILLEQIDGSEHNHYVKTDSWREKGIGMTGIECGLNFAEDGEILLKPGKTHLKLKISKAELGMLPKDSQKAKEHPTFMEVWPNVFGFRPEYFGMSNNAASLNCHFVQHVYAEMAQYTKPIKNDLTLMKLCGYSLEMSLNGGMGYGSNRKFYIDSDASVLIGSGTYIKSTQDREWASRNWDPIQACANRLLAAVDKSGLIVSQTLSGNSGEYNWSSNWWDVISFGHLDAYSNALAYKAFLSAAYIAKRLERTVEEEHYIEAAEAIKLAYFKCFYDPLTGWLAGWKSKDGKIHDYAFLFVNGIAITYGLVPEKNIVQIVEKLEEKRKAVGYHHFHLGLPGNLMPILKSDYARDVYGSGQREDGLDSFGIYENGGATMSQSYYYLRALEIAKMPVVREIEEAFLESFIKGEVFGGLGSGCDWKSWDGLSVGYEGMLSDQFYVLLAIAINRGFVESQEI